MPTLLCWNILHGGGARRIPEIVLALLEIAPDAIALNEYRSTMGGQLRAVLGDHGWTHQACTDPPRNRNGTLIASRSPVRVRAGEPPPACLAQRWLDVALEAWNLSLIALHLPEDQRPREKLESWSHLLRVARARREEPLVFLGDFNTGRHRMDEAQSTSACSAHMGRLWSMGYRDAWREGSERGRVGAFEASWVSPRGAGFRIDHAFVSPPLAPAIEHAEYLPGLRDAGLSDHAPLVVRLSGVARPTENPEKNGLFVPARADTPCRERKTL